MGSEAGAIFEFVCSPVDSNDGEDGEYKHQYTGC